jgi:hypothetical protein
MEFDEDGNPKEESVNMLAPDNRNDWLSHDYNRREGCKLDHYGTTVCNY